MEISTQSDLIQALERIARRLEDKLKSPDRDTSMIVSASTVGELTLLCSSDAPQKLLENR